MKYHFKISEPHISKVSQHLFPGDGKEAVALLICGRYVTQEVESFFVHKVIPIPYEECQRSSDHIIWKTSLLEEILPLAIKKELAIFKIHSHPNGYSQFSEIDDKSDLELFESIYGWFCTSKPHGSLVMLPNGDLFGRVIDENLNFIPIDKVSKVSYDLSISEDRSGLEVEEISLRNRQTLGIGTTQLLKKLKVGVIGCSGTGSLVIEQLARLGVGELVIIDPDIVELKNLNRILNTTKIDAQNARYKVDVLEAAIHGMGFNTIVKSYKSNLYDDLEAIEDLCSCDFIFGCVDSIDGRHLINVISTFYLIPFIDVGIKIISDKRGGIDQICGTIHYIQPGGSSLLTRGVYTSEELRAANLLRVEPQEYHEQIAYGYITDIDVEAPAVINVNMLASSLAVNEFLSRLHPIKNEPLEDYDIIRFSLTDYYFMHEKSPSDPHLYLNKYIGRGNMLPLLNMPIFSHATTN